MIISIKTLVKEVQFDLILPMYKDQKINYNFEYTLFMNDVLCFL